MAIISQLFQMMNLYRHRASRPYFEPPPPKTIEGGLNFFPHRYLVPPKIFH